MNFYIYYFLYVQGNIKNRARFTSRILAHLDDIEQIEFWYEQLLEIVQESDRICRDLPLVLYFTRLPVLTQIQLHLGQSDF